MTPAQHEIALILLEAIALVGAWFLHGHVERQIRVGLKAHRGELLMVRIVMGVFGVLMIVSVMLLIRGD